MLLDVALWLVVVVLLLPGISGYLATIKNGHYCSYVGHKQKETISYSGNINLDIVSTTCIMHVGWFS